MTGMIIATAMKRIAICLALVCTASAQADLVTQEQIITPNYTGVTTIKIKGTKIRMDMYEGQPQAMSTITDLNTGEIINLLHGQKLYVRSYNRPAPKSSNSDSLAPVPKPTGKTQKVGDYNTELYTWSNARGINGTVWVAKDYPNYDRIRTDYATLDRAPGADTDVTPALSKLPGMVVRSQVSGGGQTITLALISAREGPLDATLFAIPRAYKEVPQPKPLIANTPPPPTAPAAPKASGSSPAKSPAAPAKTSNSKLPPW
jgi:hypothetical protein